EQWIRRDRVKQVTPSILAWSERHAGSGTSREMPVPELIWAGVREDTYNVYENQVVLRQLMELRDLLRKYQSIVRVEIQSKAEYYLHRVNHWLRSSFLRGIRPHAGPISVSQVFRKHPIYRIWYTWFHQLYQFSEYT